MSLIGVLYSVNVSSSEPVFSAALSVLSLPGGLVESSSGSV